MVISFSFSYSRHHCHQHHHHRRRCLCPHSLFWMMHLNSFYVWRETEVKKNIFEFTQAICISYDYLLAVCFTFSAIHFKSAVHFKTKRTQRKNGLSRVHLIECLISGRIWMCVRLLLWHFTIYSESMQINERTMPIKCIDAKMSIIIILCVCFCVIRVCVSVCVCTALWIDCMRCTRITIIVSHFVTLFHFNQM